MLEGEGSCNPSSRTQGQRRGAMSKSEAEEDAETETRAQSEVETDGKSTERGGGGQDTETDGQTEIHPPATASLSQKQRATLRYTQLETD